VIPKPAQYLLRFDDLCPTMPRVRWQRFLDVVEKFGIRPIVGIVPDNRDPELEREPADPEFWAGMRAIEGAGATIAVHGYRHLCGDRGKSLLGLHRTTEFAGVDYETQRKWIREGFRIIRGQGLNPRLWIAPRHGFDRNTLRALRHSGVEYISDGFARIPHRRHGITWIPQQLWRPVSKEKGLWTICIHPYAAGAADAERLERFMEARRHQFTSFDRVLEEFPNRSLGVWERILEQTALWRTRRRHLRRRRKKLQR
jgi:predicted deacetylase